MNPQFQQNPKGIPPELQELMPFLIGFVCVIAVIGLVIQTFYCLTLSKALSRCAERNRVMQPGMVWLLFIPCFNYVWVFFIGTQVPDSLKKEFEDRGRDDGSDYGRSLGLWMAILLVGSVVLSFIPIIGIIGSIGSIVYIVMWIMFWVKIAGYSNQLGEPGESSRRAYGADEDYD
jgi:hypothetical protein